MKKRSIISTKSLGIDDKPVDKLLMQTKNNKGPRIERCGIPACTAVLPEDCLFRTTL